MLAHPLFPALPIARLVPLAVLLLLGACAQVEVQSASAPSVLAAPPELVPVAALPLSPAAAASVSFVPPPRPVVFVPPPRHVVVLPQPAPVIVVQPPRVVVVTPPPPVFVYPAPEIVLPGDGAPGDWTPVTH